MSHPVRRSLSATDVIRDLRNPAANNLPAGIGFAIFADALRPPNFLEVYDPHGHLVDRCPQCRDNGRGSRCLDGRVLTAIW